MVEDYVKEPKDILLRFKPEDIDRIRKEVNLDNTDYREEAIDIIDKWIKSQDHFKKKDFSKGYIERCIITCKGSLERTKQQIDNICTMRTIMPHIFQITSLKDKKIEHLFHQLGNGALLPKLTKECYRVIVIKLHPNVQIESSDISLLFKGIIYTAECFKSTDFNLGFKVIFDILDTNAADVLSKINFIELKQFINVFTAGYGFKIKGIYFVTSSKFIEKFVNMLKPLFSEKVGKRIEVLTDRIFLKNFIDEEILPSDYGGPEKAMQQLQEHTIETFSTIPMQELVKEMKKAVVDESKRDNSKFIEEYMGIPGTFRTLSVD